MDKTGNTTMSEEMAGMANLMAHPLASGAALSAYGIGLASQAFGTWMGALAGMAEVSQRMFQPVDDAEATAAASPQEQAAAPAGAEMPARVVALAAAENTPVLMPEDFRQPKPMERPEVPDDLKAISGIGPKLEQVLNGLGIWTYGQIAGWSPEEVAWIEDYLGFKGRVGRDGWLAQAAGLAGAETKQ